VADQVVAALGLLDHRGRQPERDLDLVHLIAVAPETYERCVEVIEPQAQPFRRIALGVRGDEDHLDLAPDLQRKVVEHGPDIRHVDRADIGTVGVAEEEQRDTAFGLRPEIERLAGGVEECEVDLLLGPGHFPAAIAARAGTIVASRAGGKD
jgi:hypothetical protein